MIDASKQVAAQCNAVAHMATALARVYSAFARMHLEGAAEPLVQIHGEDSLRLMETLGDAINEMDAVADGDDLAQVFEMARKMFPHAVMVENE